MESLKIANRLFEQGDYCEAIKRYESLKLIYPLLSEVIEKQIITAKIMDKNQKKDNKDFELVFSPLIDFGWVAVITLWKRVSYLEEQLNAIVNQTIPPNEIIIIQNENHFEIDRELVKKFNLKIVKSDLNSLYTRWIVGYLADAKYVHVFDDDVIPGKKWIESCIRVCETYNVLVGPSGRIAQPDQIPAWMSVDINVKEGRGIACTDKDVVCDWVCNAYFFKIEWIKYIVSAGRYQSTQKTFDDIQLATTLKFYGGIKTMVPQQSKQDFEINGHIKREYGHDEHALWKRQKSEHLEKRGELINQIDNAENFTWNSVESLGMVE